MNSQMFRAPLKRQRLAIVVPSVHGPLTPFNLVGTHRSGARGALRGGCRGRGGVGGADGGGRGARGPTKRAFGFFRRGGRGRRPPTESEFSYCFFSNPTDPAMPQHPESISSTGYA